MHAGAGVCSWAGSGMSREGGAGSSRAAAHHWVCNCFPPAPACSSDPALVERERQRFLRALQPVLAHPGPKLIVTDSQASQGKHTRGQGSLQQQQQQSIELASVWPNCAALLRIWPALCV